MEMPGPGDDSAAGNSESGRTRSGHTDARPSLIPGMDRRGRLRRSSLGGPSLMIRTVEHFTHVRNGRACATLWTAIRHDSVPAWATQHPAAVTPAMPY